MHYHLKVNRSRPFQACEAFNIAGRDAQSTPAVPVPKTYGNLYLSSLKHLKTTKSDVVERHFTSTRFFWSRFPYWFPVAPWGIFTSHEQKSSFLLLWQDGWMHFSRAWRSHFSSASPALVLSENRLALNFWIIIIPKLFPLIYLKGFKQPLIESKSGKFYVSLLFLRAISICDWYHLEHPDDLQEIGCSCFQLTGMVLKLIGSIMMRFIMIII